MENLSAFNSALVLTAIECVGDTAAKLDDRLPVYASYNALAYVLPIVLQKHPMAIVNGYWNAMTNMTHLAIGVYLGDKISNQQIAGVVVGAFAILLMNEVF
jgi:hypothetical protein